MKAEELRIGNFVEIDVIDEILRVDTVSQSKPIGSQETGGFIVSNGHVPVITLDACKPIPLTEEWLLKFGFELEGNEFDKENISIQYWYHDNTYHWVSSSGDVDVLLKHVHQLQNLFHALTNTELEIKD